jgi:hypothetical protein
MAKIRKMLNDWDAPYIQSLVNLIETQSEKTLTKWVLDYSEQLLLPLWIKYYPDDLRPEVALNAASRYLSGEIKLQEAKKAINECRDAARIAEEPVAQTAARAIGQSAATIYSARECIGLPLYGALAIAYEIIGTSAPWEQVEKSAANECRKMLAALSAIAIKNELNPAKIDWNC